MYIHMYMHVYTSWYLEPNYLCVVWVSGRSCETRTFTIHIQGFVVPCTACFQIHAAICMFLCLIYTFVVV